MDISDRPRYIFLEEGDIIQEGDEIRGIGYSMYPSEDNVMCGDWLLLTERSEPGSQYINKAVEYECYEIRRKVK